LLLFVLLTYSESKATDKYDILVNDDYSGLEQLSPRVAVGHSGDFVVVWVDKRNGQNDIYSQWFDSTGRAIETNLQVNDNDNSVPQFEPVVAGNNSNQFAAVWKDYRNGSYPFQPDIYFSRIDTLQSYNDLNVTTEPPDSIKESPDIALFPNGSSIVVWSDYRNRNWDIYGQKLDINGNLVGKNFKINNEAGTFQQHSPKVATFHDGGFIVVWYDNRYGNDDIFGQIYDASGNAVGTNTKLSDDLGTTRQAFPSVATDGDKGIFVGWVDWRNGVYPQNPDIYFQRLDSSANIIGPAMRVNLDGGSTAQREVSICGDWIGNVAFVWADSSSGQWDVMAQIIDHSGQLVGSNFRVHQVQTGRQLQPDVETDDYKLYFTWADSRSGNFDIYVTIYQYNEPELLVEPTEVNFTMELAGALPSQQQVIIENAGLSPIQWSASPTAEWISLSPAVGVTPDTILVSINDGSLPYGDHYAGLKLINLDNHDSSLALPVKLSVTAPFLDIVPDSLNFRVFAAMGNPIPQMIQINNIGTGTLTWLATENALWFEIDKSSGNQSEQVVVTVDIGGLLYGHYYEPLIINSAEAVNSPETAIVHLELVGNIPFLIAYPDSFHYDAKQGEILNGAIQILNTGDGALNWHADAMDDWVSLQSSSGSDNDLINFSLYTSGLMVGNHYTGIIIYDSMAFNESVMVLIDISLSPPDAIIKPDTIIIGNSEIFSGQMAAIPIEITLVSPSKGGYIPLECDTNIIRMDSIVLNSSAFPGFIEISKRIISGQNGEIGFRVQPIFINDSSISQGKYNIGSLYFSSTLMAGESVIDTSNFDSSGIYLLDTALAKHIPIFHSGLAKVNAPPALIPDTLKFKDIQTSVNLNAVMPITIRLSQARLGGYIPFQYDDNFLKLDSIKLNNSGFPSFVEFSSGIGMNGIGEIEFYVQQPISQKISAGNYDIGSLYFTTGSEPAIIEIDTSHSDSSSIYIIDTTGDKIIPIVSSGNLVIDRTTGWEQSEFNELIPQNIGLNQNSPNPFNSNTSIDIFLPHSMKISLEIYNLLGQRVAILFQGDLPGGYSRMNWDGMMLDSRPAPSGIYFYCLTVNGTTLTRKMALLK
jgi:hypothetical protein